MTIVSFRGVAMAKWTRAVVLIVLCSSSAFTQEKTSLQMGHYLGPVHTVHIEQTLLRAREAEPHKVWVSDATFDPHGNMTESTSYGEDGKIQRKLSWEHSYDTQGRVIETRYLDATRDLTNTGRYSYRESERTVDLVQINPDSSINHNATRLYDEAGNLVRYTREYPARGTFYETMVYDKKGNLIERRSYKGNDELTERSVWKYDDSGNEIEWMVYKPDGSSVQMTKRSLTCDERGNIVRAVNLSRTGSVSSEEIFTYVFDDHGNWTRRTTVRSLAGRTLDTKIMDRTLTYY